MPKTYRCRLYRTSKDVLPGEDAFAEVWDSQEEPYLEEDLPSGGGPVATFLGTSLDEVGRGLRSYLSENKIFLTGSWNARGTI